MPGGLVERDGELSRIGALLAAARAGSGGALVIAGPAGIGKTSLLGAARERAGLAGMRVLSGRGGELEGGFPFGVARQLFEPLLAGASGAGREALLAGAAHRALGAMEDGAGPAVPTAQDSPLFGVIHGLYWLAVNASGAVPVLVAIDDLHWADRASLRFVLYLADRLAGLPVALALAWRPGEETAAGEGNWLARLEQVAAGGVLSPGALSRAAVEVLLEGAFGAAPGEEFTAVCHGVTGGNPFLVRELIEELRADDVVLRPLGYEQYDGRLWRLVWSPVTVLASTNALRGSTSGVGVSPVSTRPAASRAQIRAQIPAADLPVLGTPRTPVLAGRQPPPRALDRAGPFGPDPMCQGSRSDRVRLGFDAADTAGVMSQTAPGRHVLCR